MKFQTKIFFATLVILISTLTLNSILSISSFENIYVESLISTYETGGKNLKRKIEQSLRFGKPLDKFEGMEDLLKDFMLKNTHIEFTGIINTKKEIIYHTDSSRRGNLLEYDIPEFNEKKAATRLTDNFYISFLPLYSSKTILKGYIFLGFSEDSITNKIQNMAFANFKTLSVLILFTGISLIFFLGIIIVKPLKTDIKKISLQMSSIEKGIDLSKSAKDDLFSNLEPALLSSDALSETAYSYFDVSKIKNEIWQLNLYMKKFYLSYSRGISDIDNLKTDFFRLKNKIELYLNDSEELLKVYMEEHPQDYIIKPLYKSFLRENMHIKELIQLTFLFLTTEKNENLITQDYSDKENDV